MSEKSISNVEKLLQTVSYKGVEFEIIERPNVIWVGCVDYAGNNSDESDIAKTLKRYREELIEIPKQELINPGWSASISINYGCEDKPCGIMFAQETYSDKQDERYELLTQPGGLWLRVKITSETDTVLFGRQNYGGFEYFGVLRTAAEENGYKQNPDVTIEIEYHCHAEYNNPPHTNYNYISICTK